MFSFSLATILSAFIAFNVFIVTYMYLAISVFTEPHESAEYLIGFLISSAAGSIVALASWSLIDYFGYKYARYQTIQCVVTEKYYTASNSSLGIGTSVTADGSASTVVTTNHTPEIFTVEVKLADDQVMRHETNEYYFNSVKRGDHVQLSFRFSEYSSVAHWDEAILKL